MSDETTEPEDAPKKGGKKGLLIGLVLSLVLGGGGFFAAYSGMIPGTGGPEQVVKKPEITEAQPSFVPIDPMVISLGRGARNHLRFNAQLEVDPEKSDAVVNAMPRILDVLNGYLRAVELAELEDPAALIRLRAQMLRRVQLVTGKGHVRDLLITEFVFT